MRDVVVVQASRSPIGRRDGSLATMHAIDLLGAIQLAVVERSGIEPIEIGQVIGGCVGQVGMQSMNVTRNAWLGAGLPATVPATTVDTQCGSSQQATTLAYGLVAAGVVDVALACGVEIMSRVPMGATTPQSPDVGKPINRTYWAHHEYTTQFEAAERMAERWQITRGAADELAKLSQDRAAAAWEQGRFDPQIVPVEVPIFDEDDRPTSDLRRVVRDEGMRPTTLEGLATLRPTGRPDGVHTAGSSSQISDGAAAVLLMTADKAASLGLRPLATIADVCTVGTDPAMMLEGPIPATRHLLDRNGLSMGDIDLVEINEAFASVVLAWQREVGADLDDVNPNGGAIALGHPLGATGAVLLTKAAHELDRSDGEHAIVTMCCAGGLGTGTLLRRA